MITDKDPLRGVVVLLGFRFLSHTTRSETPPPRRRWRRACCLLFRGRPHRDSARPFYLLRRRPRILLWPRTAKSRGVAPVPLLLLLCTLLWRRCTPLPHQRCCEAWILDGPASGKKGSKVNGPGPGAHRCALQQRARPAPQRPRHRVRPLHPTPYDLNPKPETRNSRPNTRNPKPSALNTHQHSALNTNSSPTNAQP